MKPILHAALCAALLTPALDAQTKVLDDFTGSSINESTWWLEGYQKSLSVGSGTLITRLPKDHWVGMLSNDAIGGDFDIVVDFSNFSATGPAQERANFSMSVIRAKGRIDKIAVVEVGIAGNSSVSEFGWFAESGGSPIGSGWTPTTATGGELRVRRVSTPTRPQIEIMVRPTGQKSWTTLKTLSDILGDEVYVQLWSETELNGTVSSTCDRVRYDGNLVLSPRPYGKGCNGYLARHFGRASLGNPDFGIYSAEAPANAPSFLMLGFTQLAIDLTGAGAFGCTLYTTPDLIFPGPVLSQDGEGIFYFPIPNLPAFVGLPLHFQPFAFELNANALNLVFGNGVRAHIVKP